MNTTDLFLKWWVSSMWSKKKSFTKQTAKEAIMEAWANAFSVACEPKPLCGLDISSKLPSLLSVINVIAAKGSCTRTEEIEEVYDVILKLGNLAKQ